MCFIQSLLACPADRHLEEYSNNCSNKIVASLAAHSDLLSLYYHLTDYYHVTALCLSNLNLTLRFLNSNRRRQNHHHLG